MKHINVFYYATSIISIASVEEALNFRWDSVKDWYVKYQTLYISTNDGRNLEYDFSHEPFEIGDTKRPLDTDLVEF